MLRLNTAIAPTAAANQSVCGLLGGDPAGFPNGRRIADDVLAIEGRAIAGVTWPLFDASYVPEAAAGKLTDGLTPADLGAPFLSQFPYLGLAPRRALTCRCPLARTSCDTFMAP